MTTRAVRRLFWRPRGRRSGPGDPEAAERHDARLAALGVQLGRLGHDLRGILSPALLAAERLQAHSDPSVRRSADALVRAVDRATEALRDGLHTLRDGLPEARRDPVNLAGAVAGAAGRAPRCTVNVPAEAVVQADPGYLSRAWESLFAALRAAGASRVTLEGSCDCGAWTIACLHDAEQGESAPAIGALPAFLLARDLMRACGGNLIERDATSLVATFSRA